MLLMGLILIFCCTVVAGLIIYAKTGDGSYAVMGGIFFGGCTGLIIFLIIVLGQDAEGVEQVLTQW